jgi:hypothetical protein
MQLQVGLPLYQTEQFELLYKYVDALSEIQYREYFSEFTTRLLWFMKMPIIKQFLNASFSSPPCSPQQITLLTNTFAKIRAYNNFGKNWQNSPYISI